MGRASQRKEARRQVWVRTGGVPTRACVVCHARLDAAHELTFDAPSVGPIEMPEHSVTVCAYCGAVLVLEAGAFRVMTAEEWATLDADQQRILSSWPQPETEGKGRR